MPSIRGGFPGDMISSFDGFYINNPYHFGGGFSIFDPRMVQSAQLSHGVFSSRYGHSISGLLEITSKDPSPSETLFELGLNTSAANLSLSIPLFGKGGILFMGRLTYYDPVIGIVKLLSNQFPVLDPVNYIKQAPYIRSGAVSGNYRFADKLKFAATGFWGMDGAGVNFLNSNRIEGYLNSDTTIDFDFKNFQGFFTSSLTWNPLSAMLIKFSAGTGYENMIADGGMIYDIKDKTFSDAFLEKYPYLESYLHDAFYQNHGVYFSDFSFNAQARFDLDWEINNNFIFSAGVQEMYELGKSTGNADVSLEPLFTELPSDEQQKIKYLLGLLFLGNPIADNSVFWKDLGISMPYNASIDSDNHLLTSSGYALTEFITSSNRFKAELGVRLDHFLLLGNGFTLSSKPVLNPRLNMDFTVVRNKNFLKSLDISGGTGLFSSINNAASFADKEHKVDKIMPNRSWTSVLGIKFEFPQSFILNIEGYYKHIWDRMYIPISFGNEGSLDMAPSTDGVGKAFGVDVMLQKIQSRFFDGWISYSYNWTKYRDPMSENAAISLSGGTEGESWYFPSFHRFHYLNLILNIKPVQNINIYIRFGLASGVLLERRIGDGPQSYPVLVVDEKNPLNSYFIEKFRWPSEPDESNRAKPALPMDIKFSIFGSNKKGKTKYEVYVAVENVLALLYKSEGNTSFNSYTGQIDTGSSSATFEIPMPIPSFGFKISY